MHFFPTHSLYIEVYLSYISLPSLHGNSFSKNSFQKLLVITLHLISFGALHHPLYPFTISPLPPYFLSLSHFLPIDLYNLRYPIISTTHFLPILHHLQSHSSHHFQQTKVDRIDFKLEYTSIFITSFICFIIINCF